ncbi:pyridoxal-5'-phosphate-dependent protein subunit beta [Parafrankia soli]|uniref:threonine ammonia-lyase n=1 Tax=Parafrankia soli TaxID=2599596 RepID=A0A1S1PRB9_9ACTN|nr:pyridoxal-phosphate dependent enzyme [Parafrankia soli]OHV22464.1 pyridoxal-5'-phosphate-dependent protein subunit beta [Parafrankia soli]
MTSPSVSGPSATGASPSRVGDTADADDTGDREAVAAPAVTPVTPAAARVGARPGLLRPGSARRASTRRTFGPRAAASGREAGCRPGNGTPLPPDATVPAGTLAAEALAAEALSVGALAVDVADVVAAADGLRGVARRTRVVADADLTRLTGSPVWLKCEHEQHTGSFKLRGAYHRIAVAGPHARERGVVAASAGNHAQGVAFAAARFGVEATIFVPESANPSKVASTRRWGARVEYVPGGVDAALAAAAAFANEGGRLLVHPFDDAAVIAGQGTIGLELLEQVPNLATVIVGVGGGGLLCGLAVAIKGLRPDVRVIGVQSAAAPAFATSFRAGRRVTVPPGSAGTTETVGQPGTAAGTIADGMAVAAPGRLTLELATRLVDDVVTVDESAFWEAMVLLRRAGQRVEPAGAAGVAALLRTPRLAVGPTAVVISGGNLDPAVDARVAALAGAGALSAAGTGSVGGDPAGSAGSAAGRRTVA